MVLIDNSKLVIIRIYKEHFINFIYGVRLSIYIIGRYKTRISEKSFSRTTLVSRVALHFFLSLGSSVMVSKNDIKL